MFSFICLFYHPMILKYSNLFPKTLQVYPIFPHMSKLFCFSDQLYAFYLILSLPFLCFQNSFSAVFYHPAEHIRSCIRSV